MTHLCIDIGNTNIVFAFLENDKIFKKVRVETQKNSPSDLSFLTEEKVEAVVIGSVVPTVESIIFDFCKKNVTPNVKIVSVQDALSAMPSTYKEHSNLGIDRILNSIAAYHKYKTSVIIVDFGTATTFDVVSKKGEFLGGIICYGIKTAGNALFAHTQKLPPIDFDNVGKKINVIGKTTEECLKSGLIIGYAKLVDGLIAEIQKDLKGEAKVIACGGLASLIEPFTKSIEALEEDLTIMGLFFVLRQLEAQLDI